MKDLSKTNFYKINFWNNAKSYLRNEAPHLEDGEVAQLFRV